MKRRQRSFLYSFVVVTAYIWINSRRHAWSFGKVELDPCTPKTCLQLIRRNLQCDSIQQEVPFLTNNTWVDRTHNIGFTLVPKCGSTSLRAIQFLKSGYFTEITNFANVTSDQMWPVVESKHHVKKLEKQEVNELSDMKFVTGIRDPLSRLISAYKDKIGRKSLTLADFFFANFDQNLIIQGQRSRQWFWERYGKHIIERYRKNYPNLRQLTSRGIPKSEIEAIIFGLIPTFPEFVDYIIDMDPNHNAHWAPLTDQVDFCKLNYELIFKVENLNEQLATVYSDLGAGTLESIARIGAHQTNTKANTSQSYVDQLSDRQRSGLQKIYRNDFLAFSSIYSSSFI